MAAPCIFCQIARGEAPSDSLHTDELVIAFLDIAPITPGHALIIPRDHHSSLTTVPPATLAAMFGLAARLGQAIVRASKADGFNLHLANGAVAGQIVMHTHLHVIPRSPTDGFSWGWRAQPGGDPAARQALALAIRDRLARTPGHGD
jgi:histidine triad (HIT) family protein